MSTPAGQRRRQRGRQWRGGARSAPPAGTAWEAPRAAAAAAHARPAVSPFPARSPRPAVAPAAPAASTTAASPNDRRLKLRACSRRPGGGARGAQGRAMPAGTGRGAAAAAGAVVQRWGARRHAAPASACPGASGAAFTPPTLARCSPPHALRTTHCPSSTRSHSVRSVTHSQLAGRWSLRTLTAERSAALLRTAI
jgi:hypothetical protein